MSIVAIAWIADGVEASETEAVQELVYLAAFHETLAASLIGLQWLTDGIAETETEGLENFRYLAFDSKAAARHLASLPWFLDGITETEVGAISNLAYIAQNNAAAAERIVGMPFVAAIEPADASALETLADLAAFEKGSFNRVMAHTSIVRGITDSLAPIVAVLYGAAKTNPSLIERLLEPGSVYMERRSVTLPLTGEVDLVIVRTAPGAVSSMDLLEHSVRASEELMGQPFPTRYVGLLYEDAVKGAYAGRNFGTHIVVLPKYDVDDGSREAEFAPHAIAHEVAHYFWSGNADWIDEGVSDFMASSIENMRTGRSIRVTNDPCAYARSIMELEALVPDADSDFDVFGCNYSLGERLFVDLYRSLGRDAIWQGLRDLYAKSVVEDDDDDLRGTALGIRQVREVFDSAAASSIAIGRWYEGTEIYDVSRLDLHPADQTLPSINGQLDEAYITIGDNGPRVSKFSVQDAENRTVWLNLDYSYRVAGGSHKLTLDLLEFYEDGFEFRRDSVELTAESQYIGGGSSVSVGPERWAPGHYWVYIFDGDRKVAEVRYEVVS